MSNHSNGCLGCQAIETSPVTLRTGITVCTSCPDWMLECEARKCLTMPKPARIKYLADVEKQRGKEASEVLRNEVSEQWSVRDILKWKVG